MPTAPASNGNVFPLRRNTAHDPDAGMPPSGTPANASVKEAPSTLTSSHGRAQKRRQAWLRECAIIAFSYTLNGAFISLFALTDTVRWTAGLLYAVPGIVASALIAQLIASGFSLRLKDPSLADAHSATSAVLCLFGLAVFAQMAFVYGLILFVTFITATYRTPKRQLSIALVVVTLMMCLLTVGPGHKLQIPHTTRGEQFIVWLFFLVTLGRCVMLSVINASSNRLLRVRGQQMASTLAQIERLANHDELTGVLNRRRLMHILGEETARAERSGAPLSVAMLDLDHFKVVNDTLGHLAGDQVLKQFATTAQANTRITDRFGRYGGEEFLMILTDADAPQADRAVDRIRQALFAFDWNVIAPTLHITFSAGIATYRSGEDPATLLNRADQGLYAAKRDGRNCTRAA